MHATVTVLAHSPLQRIIVDLLGNKKFERSVSEEIKGKCDEQQEIGEKKQTYLKETRNSNVWRSDGDKRKQTRKKTKEHNTTAQALNTENARKNHKHEPGLSFFAHTFQQTHKRKRPHDVHVQLQAHMCAREGREVYGTNTHTRRTCSAETR